MTAKAFIIWLIAVAALAVTITLLNEHIAYISAGLIVLFFGYCWFVIVREYDTVFDEPDARWLLVVTILTIANWFGIFVW